MNAGSRPGLPLKVCQGRVTSPALLGVKSIGGVTPSLPALAKPEAALELVLVAVEPDRQQDYKRDSDEKKS